MNTNIFYLMFEILSSQIDLAIRKHQSWNGEQSYKLHQEDSNTFLKDCI